MPSLQDDLFILGLDSAGADLKHDILTLEAMADWNQFYEDNGFKDQVNRDYGGLNGLAKELGIPYDANGERVVTTGRSASPLVHKRYPNQPHEWHGYFGSGKENISEVVSDDSASAAVEAGPPLLTATVGTKDITNSDEATKIIQTGPKDSPVVLDMKKGFPKYTEDEAVDCKKDVASRISKNCTASTDDILHAAYDGTPSGVPVIANQTFQGGFRKAAISYLVGIWARTSNDSHPLSLAMQDAAKQEFGLEDTKSWQGDVAKSKIGDDMAGGVYGAAKIVAKSGPTLQAFLRAQYTDTQQMLADQNVKSVVLYRGQGVKPDGLAEGDAESAKTAGDLGTLSSHKLGEAQMRPMSSWTSDLTKAIAFAKRAHDAGEGSGYVMSCQVPASQIMSTPRTGNGCLDESEFVVLGNTKDMTVELVTDYLDLGEDMDDE